MLVLQTALVQTKTTHWVTLTTKTFQNSFNREPRTRWYKLNKSHDSNANICTPISKNWICVMSCFQLSEIIKKKSERTMKPNPIYVDKRMCATKQAVEYKYKLGIEY